jgi:hypothetical protein
LHLNTTTTISKLFYITKLIMHTSLNTKRRVLFASVLASLLVVGCGGGGSSSQIRPTKAMYDQITVGMPYTQVVSIVGGAGNRGTGGFGGDTNEVMWSITDPYARLVVHLQDEKVTIKFYEGTETGGKGVAFP